MSFQDYIIQFIKSISEIQCLRNDHVSIRAKEVLSYWQYLRRNDCFTDLTVYCGMDFGCVSLHGAILGACSPLIATILNENSRMSSRDENVIFLPDCEKDDFVELVKVSSKIYGCMLVFS